MAPQLLYPVPSSLFCICWLLSGSIPFLCIQPLVFFLSSLLLSQSISHMPDGETLLLIFMISQ